MWQMTQHLQQLQAENSEMSNLHWKYWLYQFSVLAKIIPTVAHSVSDRPHT
jgi:hypothetical protein